MSLENFKKRIKNLNPCLSKPFPLILQSIYFDLFTLVLFRNHIHIFKQMSQLKLPMSKLNAIIFLFFLTNLTSCIPTIKEQPTPDVLNTAVDWQLLPIVNADQPITSVHATPYEIYFLTNNALFRVDFNQNLQEKRLLQSDRTFFGLPVMSDNTFVRVLQENNRDFVEFQLARNATNVKRISTAQLVDSVKGESFRVEQVSQRPSGCYSSDGSKFFLPGVIIPNNKPAVMILDVRLDFQGTNFVSVGLAKRVEILNLSIADATIESCRFLRGNMYLATKDGGFRITPDGVVKKLFNHWVKDFYEIDAVLYSTGFNASDYFKSTDDGSTWSRAGINTMQYVETTGTKVFSQSQRSLRFGIADSSLTKVKELYYSPSLAAKSGSIYSIAFFKDRYFINFENKVYSLKDPKAK